MAFLSGLTLASSLHAQSGKNFFEGKTLSYLVGSTAGGGSDIIARLVARHFERHIPGKPRIEELAPAGTKSLLAALYASQNLSRSVAMNPGVPADQVKIMRDAFAAITKDEQFIKESAKMGLEIDLIRGEEMNRDIEVTMGDKRLMDMYKTITSVK